MQSLAEHSALVTGAGRGIGKALALRLAAEGANVTLTARSAAEIAEVATQIEANGGKAQAIATDVTDPVGVAKAVAAATARFGPVSILVNNAGVPGPYALLASGKYDGIAGRYLDIAWDLDRPETFSSAVSSTPQLPPPTHQG